MFNQTTRNAHRFCTLVKYLLFCEAAQLKTSCVSKSKIEKKVNVIVEFIAAFSCSEKHHQNFAHKKAGEIDLAKEI